MKHKTIRSLLIALSLLFAVPCLGAEQSAFSAWWNRLKTRVMNSVAYYAPSFMSRWRPETPPAELHAQHVAPEKHPEPFSPEYMPAIKSNAKKELIKNIQALKEYKKDTAAFVTALETTQRLLGTLARVQENERHREIIEKVLSEVNAHRELPVQKKRKHLIFRIQVAQELP